MVIPWTEVDPLGCSGYIGVGAFGGTNGRIYLDDLVWAVHDEIPGVPANTEDLPLTFDLRQNYPNPFNPTTTIDFTIPETGYATLKVYNLAGEVVSTLVDGMVERGLNSISFDAGALSSGVHFYTLECAGLLSTRKMVLVK